MRNPDVRREDFASAQIIAEQGRKKSDKRRRNAGRLETRQTVPERRRCSLHEEAQQAWHGDNVLANADKLVREIKVSTASTPDTTHFDDLLNTANESELLADKGYVDSEREARLAKKGLRMHIERKDGKNKPISDTQQQNNYRIARDIRASSMFSQAWHRWEGKR